MRKAIVCLLAFFVVGCNSQQRAAEEAVSRQLRDPSSAQFRDVAAVYPGASGAVCGQVNSKNGFGAYVGFRPFVTNGIQVSIGADDGQAILVRNCCDAIKRQRELDVKLSDSPTAKGQCAAISPPFYL